MKTELEKKAEVDMTDDEIYKIIKQKKTHHNREIAIMFVGAKMMLTHLQSQKAEWKTDIESLRQKYINDYIGVTTDAGTVIANINMDLSEILKKYKR